MTFFFFCRESLAPQTRAAGFLLLLFLLFPAAYKNKTEPEL